MKDQELQDFLDGSDKETIKYYLDNLKTKLSELSTRNDRILILMLLTVVSYYLIENSMLSSVKLGFVELNRFDYALIIIPPIFSFLYLYYIVQFFHSSEIRKASKNISNHLFKGENKEIDPDSFAGDLINNFLPYSFFDDINKIFTTGSKAGCVSMLFIVLLSFPIVGIYFTPFIFQYYSLKKMLIEQWNNGFLARVLIILTIWLIVYTVFFIIKFFIHTYKTNSSTPQSK